MIAKDLKNFIYRPDLRQVHFKVGDQLVVIDDRELALLSPRILKVDPRPLVPEKKPIPHRLTRKIVI